MLPLAASLAAIGVASAIAYGVYIGGSSVTANQQSRHKSVALLLQAAYVLMSEGTDADSDSTKEVAGSLAAASAPTGGGVIPAASAAPKNDGWGRAIGYCPYDNGTATALASHIAGDNPGTTSSISFILISAGQNGKYDSSCAQALANTPQADDLVQRFTVGQALTGGSGITGFADPVLDAAQLALVPSPATGEIRLVQATGTLMEWTGSAWQQVGGAAAAAAANFLAPVEYMTDLPASDNTNGDLRVVIAENAIYAWNGAPISAWQPHLSDSTTTAGALWVWGRNSWGMLGLGDTTHRSSPTQVGALRNWKQVAANFSTFGLKTDGTLWAWGYNGWGQLGLGDLTDRSSPVQVGGLTNWRQVTTDPVGTTAAVKTDGTLWTWGQNNWGQLGNGNTTNTSSPVQVGALSDWKQAAAGGYYTAAVKTNGTLWAWGYNGLGQLGQGNGTNYSSPVQVGALTNWMQVACGYRHTIAVKTDGTLWAFGSNAYGGLGQGNTTNYSSPVQVGGGGDWKQVTGGMEFTVALKTDGTLWAWGKNNLGQLGLGHTTGRSSPVQVGGLSNYRNWAQASAGYRHSVATKTDGTLWAWGVNNYGQLGQSDTTSRSSPSQVGGLTNWKTTSSGQWHILAIK